MIRKVSGHQVYYLPPSRSLRFGGFEAAWRFTGVSPWVNLKRPLQPSKDLGFSTRNQNKEGGVEQGDKIQALRFYYKIREVLLLLSLILT